MSKTVAIPVICSCKEKKRFKYTVQLAEKQQGTPATTTSIQIDCPFSHEDNCVKHLTIKLPAGIQLKNDENIFRG